jgi:hypothetical protein
MWKRFTALLFILMLGGQVWAGVCGCLENGAPRMKCCKKKQKAEGDSMSRTQCCDSACGILAHDRLPRSQADAAFKLPVVADAIRVAFDFRPRSAFRAAPVSRPNLAVPSRLSRPPDLYLRNHSFLI